LLPESEKAEFSFCEDSIILANNQRVTVYGTAKVRIRKKLSDNGHFVFVYILHDTSHPLLLGTKYMQENKILLDFIRCSSFVDVKKTTKVKCKSTLSIQPNSECIVTGILDDRVNLGMQGVCTGHSEVTNKGLLVSRAVVTCSHDRSVHLKILNPGSDVVHINKVPF
jgi:hypothetical protein